MSLNVNKPRAIVLDIEGTTTSISFVHDKLFPFIRQHLVDYIEKHFHKKEFRDDVDLLRQQAVLDVQNGINDVPMICDWNNDDDQQIKKSIIANVFWQMDSDRKTTGLKQLQGHMWKEAYENGMIKGHLYDDVPIVLNKWKNQAIQIYIYSSGSIFAQKLLFGFSDYGDMLKFIDGHFDTTIGGKLEPPSYSAIASHLKLNPNEIIFLTDSTKEARAAKIAGINAILSVREGNSPLTEDDEIEFQILTSFLDLNFSN